MKVRKDGGWMRDGELLSIDKIYHYLDLAEPYENSPGSPLNVFTLNGIPYYLHVDVNDQSDPYGLMLEWWLSSPEEKFIDGGFEPANSDDEVAQLAGLIHGALNKVLLERRATGK
jgi:hypothetical protein